MRGRGGLLGLHFHLGAVITQLTHGIAQVMVQTAQLAVGAHHFGNDTADALDHAVGGVGQLVEFVMRVAAHRQFAGEIAGGDLSEQLNDVAQAADQGA